MLMKALSFLQPWAGIVVFWKGTPHIPVKRIENRSTLKHIRGPFLMHTGKGDDTSGRLWIYNHILREDSIPFDERLQFGRFVESDKCKTYGGIIGKMEITGLGDPDDFWALPGQNHLLMDKVEPLPFHPCKGQLSPWEMEWPPEGYGTVKCCGCGKVEMFKIIPGPQCPPDWSCGKPECNKRFRQRMGAA